MSREEEIQEKAKELAIEYCKDIDPHGKEVYNMGCYIACCEMAEWADQHPRKGLWDSEKVMLFLIGAFKELPNGNGTFKLKKECSMEQLLEDLRKAMED